MHTVRALALFGVLGFSILATGCSGGGSGATPPVASDQSPGLTGLGSPGEPTTSMSTTTSDTTVTGKITWVSTSATKFQLLESSGSSIYVYITSGTTLNYNGLTPKIGEYAEATGTGSPLTATSVTLSTSPISTSTSTTSSGTTVTGKISWVSTSATKFQLQESSGSIYVYLTSSTALHYNGLSLKVGYYASATGSGSPLTATSVTLSTSPISTTTSTTTTTTSTGVPKHVLTADYFMGEYGTMSVTPSQAAPYLSWAQTSIADSPAIRSAGIKTQFYVDAGKVYSGNGLTESLPSSTYAKTCTGTTVTETEGGHTFPIVNPNNTTYQSAFGQYVSSVLSRAKFDMIFEDNAGALSPYATYPNGKPCNYTDSSWINGFIAANNTSPLGILSNGLNIFPSSLTTMYAPDLGMLQSKMSIGGNMEHCYSDNSQTTMSGNSWIHIENTELNVMRQAKYFECMARDTYSASSSIGPRLFTLASFLLSYDPNHAVLGEEYATPSGLHVFPESQLVALNPVVSAPSDVSYLRTSTGVYARQYNACYLKGQLVGACVVAVDRSGPAAFPYSGYTHTLTISGSGILDGGTVSASGPAPPSTMSIGQGIVAFK